MKETQLIFSRCLECGYEGSDFKYFIKSGWVICPECKARKNAGASFP